MGILLPRAGLTHSLRASGAATPPTAPPALSSGHPSLREAQEVTGGQISINEKCVSFSKEKNLVLGKRSRCDDRHLATAFLTPRSRKHRTWENIWKCEKKSPNKHPGFCPNCLFWYSGAKVLVLFSWYKNLPEIQVCAPEPSKSNPKALSPCTSQGQRKSHPQ